MIYESKLESERRGVRDEDVTVTSSGFMKETLFVQVCVFMFTPQGILTTPTRPLKLTITSMHNHIQYTHIHTEILIIMAHDDSPNYHSFICDSLI